jgi:hypothetical protein
MLLLYALLHFLVRSPRLVGPTEVRDLREVSLEALCLDLHLCDYSNEMGRALFASLNPARARNIRWAVPVTDRRLLGDVDEVIFGLVLALIHIKEAAIRPPLH